LKNPRQFPTKALRRGILVLMMSHRLGAVNPVPTRLRYDSYTNTCTLPVLSLWPQLKISGPFLLRELCAWESALALETMRYRRTVLSAFVVDARGMRSGAWHTDGQTTCNLITALCMASCGNNTYPHIGLLYIFRKYDPRPIHHSGDVVREQDFQLTELIWSW